MALVDDSGLSEAERIAARVALSGDPALERELGMILPALPGPARSDFWREFLRIAADGRPPAGAVLEALIAAGGGADDSGLGGSRRSQRGAATRPPR